MQTVGHKMQGGNECDGDKSPPTSCMQNQECDSMIWDKGSTGCSAGCCSCATWSNTPVSDADPDSPVGRFNNCVINLYTKSIPVKV